MTQMSVQVIKDCIAVPADSVKNTLTLAVKRDTDEQNTGLSELTSNLLDMLKACCPAQWGQTLDTCPASYLAALLCLNQRWSEAAHLFKSRADGNQVCMLSCTVQSDHSPPIAPQEVTFTSLLQWVTYM